jgi:hypothetical protein
MAAACVEVLFSDLDGTLVHYPDDFGEYASIVAEDDDAKTATVRYNETGETRGCVVLSSMTGGKAYLSTNTVALLRQLRGLGVVFVIITGARTSTYVRRRPLLPPAEFEFFENGGRKLAAGSLDPDWTDSFAEQVGPIAERVELLPADLPAPAERAGSLWGLYREMAADGWCVDARDYTTNFRVDIDKSEGKTVEQYHAAVEGKLAPRGLATSFNLGKADIYPAGSGKANAAAHILSLLGLTAASAVAMFDDDNDLELGALVGRSFLPGVTHKGVLDALKVHGDRWTLTKSRGFLGTEEALMSVIAMRQEFSLSRGEEAASAPTATPAVLRMSKDGPWFCPVTRDAAKGHPSSPPLAFQLISSGALSREPAAGCGRIPVLVVDSGNSFQASEDGSVLKVSWPLHLREDCVAAIFGRDSVELLKSAPAPCLVNVTAFTFVCDVVPEAGNVFQELGIDSDLSSFLDVSTGKCVPATG